MSLVKSYPELHGHLPGEQLEFTPAVNGLMESIAMVTHSELAVPNWRPYPEVWGYTRGFSSAEDVSTSQFVFRTNIRLETPTFAPHLSLYRTGPLPKLYGNLSIADIYLRSPDVDFYSYNYNKAGQNLGYLMASIAVKASGKVMAGFGHGECMADPVKHPEEFQAQLALYKALGIERFRTESPRSCDEAEMDEEEVGRLASFLNNEVAGKIIPGVIGQEVKVSFIHPQVT